MNAKENVLYYFLAALLSALLGVLPFIVTKRFAAAVILGILAFLLNWWIFYASIVTTVYPLFGVVGAMTVGWWLTTALLGLLDDPDPAPVWVFSFPVLGIILFLTVHVATSAMFRANDYASMISYLGNIEENVWTQSIQPKDPAHMRMASEENAAYQAQKVLGSAGAIGSQFQIGEMTVQKVGHELMFVAPLDFVGYSVWLNSPGSPGYIKVSGEDPHRQAELVEFPKGKYMRFTPGAFFGDNLERHLRNSGYLDTGLTETNFEIDDDGNPWWVLTAFEPTIGWSGKKVLGSVIVNPFTGEDTFYKLGDVPEWVDRVIPDDFITQYVDWQGKYEGGWINSWWGSKDLTQADGSALLIYGNGDQPEWVVDITSTNVQDDSLIALLYVNSRTGESVRYQMPGGGTTSALLDAVNKNQDIQFKHLHGAAVQLYNVNGAPTGVVPLLNESHAFQGVAMVSVNDVQAVASGRNAPEAVRNYEKLLTETGRRATVEGNRDVQVTEGVVALVGNEVTPTQGTMYYVYLANVPHLFTAGAGQSAKLPVTKEGHRVRIEFYASDRDVIPMHGFDNFSIELSESPIQTEARAIDETLRSNREAAEDAQTILEQLREMDPKELRELLRSKKQ